MALITGRMVDIEGRALSGWQLRVRPLTADIVEGGARTTVPSEVEVRLDQNGRFSVDLYPSQGLTPPVPYLFLFTDPESGQRFPAIRWIPDRDTDFHDLGEIPVFAQTGGGSIEPDMLDFGGAAPQNGYMIIVQDGRFGQEPVPTGGQASDGSGSVRRSTDLQDMPHSLSAGKMLLVDSDGNTWTLTDPVTSILQLSGDDQYSDGSFWRSGSAGIYQGIILDDDLPSSITRDSEVSGWAKAGNTDPIPANKLSNAPQQGSPGNVPSPSNAQPQTDGATPDPGSTSTYARGDHRHKRFTITDAMLPAGVTRDSEVEPWAQVAHPTVKVPSAKLPALVPGNGSVGTLQLADGAVTDAKLAHTTEAQRAALRRAIGAASADNVGVDTVFGNRSFNGVREGSTRSVESGDRTSNLNWVATVEGETFTIRRFRQDGTDNDLSFMVNGTAVQVVNALEGHILEVNGHRFSFDHYKQRIRDTASPPIEYVWEAPAGVLQVGANVVRIIEPIDDDNYLPGGGRPGQMVGFAAGGTPEIVNVASYVEQAVDNRPQVILDEHAFAVNRGDWRTAQVGGMQSFDPSQTVSNTTTDRFEVIARLSNMTGTATQVNLDHEDDSPVYRAVPGKILAGLTAYTSSTANGYRLARWHFYEGATLGGTADLYLAVTGGFVAGLFLDWLPSGQSGLQSRALVAQVTATVYLQPTR